MTSLFAELKSSTRASHDSLESKLDLLAENFTMNDYRRVLERFWGMYLPVEKVVANSEIRDMYAGRWKTDLLRKDLHSLGLSDAEIDNLPSCEALPDLSSLEKILGTLYVLEGSTLGGMILTRHFGQKFNLDSLNGLRFYSSYGAKTPEMWKAWKEFSESFATSRSLNQGEIISQANHTFSALEKWLTRDC